MSARRSSALFASIVVSWAPVAAQAGDVPRQPPVSPTTTAPVAPKLTVQVIGRVKNPGSLRLDAGARLSDALTAAGTDVEKLFPRVVGAALDTDCAPGGPNLHNVFLMRTTESSKQMAYQIDVTNARRHHDLRYDPLLQDNDRVYVPECRPFILPRFPIPVEG